VRVPPDRSDQRYDPLPGLLGLPGFAWRRAPRRLRVAAVALGLLAVAGAVVAVPLVTEGKRKGDAQRTREDAAARVRELRRLRVDQAPHRGRAADAPRAPQAAREHAIVSALEGAITADVMARRRAGALPGAPVIRTVCRADAGQVAGFQPAARRAGGAVLACLAATAVGTAPGGKQFAVGYELLAAAHWGRATFTWCKTNPPPGEGFSGGDRPEVRLARACTGPGV
jgi:hypothetical protein